MMLQIFRQLFEGELICIMMYNCIHMLLGVEHTLTTKCNLWDPVSLLVTLFGKVVETLGGGT